MDTLSIARVPLDALADAAAWHEDGLPARVQAPILIFHGRLDAHVPCQESERFAAARAPGSCRLHVFEQGDHRLLAQADDMVAVAERFLSEVAA